MIPEIQREVLIPITREINVNWFHERWNQLKIEQPILYQFLSASGIDNSSLLIVLVFYKIIEAQIEVQNLEELFNDS